MMEDAISSLDRNGPDERNLEPSRLEKEVKVE